MEYILSFGILFQDKCHRESCGGSDRISADETLKRRSRALQRKYTKIEESKSFLLYPAKKG